MPTSVDLIGPVLHNIIGRSSDPRGPSRYSRTVRQVPGWPARLRASQQRASKSMEFIAHSVDDDPRICCAKRGSRVGGIHTLRITYITTCINKQWSDNNGSW